MWYKLLSIVTNSQSKAIKDIVLNKVEHEINNRVSKKVAVVVKDQEHDSVHVIDNINQNQTEKLSIKQILSEIIAGIIIEVYEDTLVMRILNGQKYEILNTLDKEFVLKKVKHYIDMQKNYNFGFQNNLDCDRYLMVKSKLFEYMKNADRLLIEGFINFRLKEYIKELENYINIAVEELFLEQRNNEFIGLLRYFVHIQTAKEDTVHIICNSRSNYSDYRLFNSMKKDITEKYFEYFFADSLSLDIDNDDMLISALITISPKKIIFHKFNDNGENTSINTEALEIIKQVFENRVYFCESCKFCDRISFDCMF